MDPLLYISTGYAPSRIHQLTNRLVCILGSAKNQEVPRSEAGRGSADDKIHRSHRTTPCCRGRLAGYISDRQWCDRKKVASGMQDCESMCFIWCTTLQVGNRKRDFLLFGERTGRERASARQSVRDHVVYAFAVVDSETILLQLHYPAPQLGRLELAS